MSTRRLPWGVLVLTLAGLVAADSLDAVRLDFSSQTYSACSRFRWACLVLQLNNGKGQTPCCVTQQLLVPCQGQITRVEHGERMSTICFLRVHLARLQSSFARD
jgi:hypothetical protein